MRQVQLEGAFNFRDLGGYQTISGQTSRWGMLYRSDDLFRLSERDCDQLNNLSIRTIVDLRTATEADLRGRPPLEKLNADYFRSSLIDISADHGFALGKTASDYVFQRYQQILVEGASNVAEVFRRLIEPNALPGVFHCAVGKDRTGLVAALALEVVGVNREQILEDYAMTALSIGAMMAWLDDNAPELASRIRQLPKIVMSSDPANLDRLLDWLSFAYGGSRCYLESNGINSSELDRFIHLLVE